LEAAAPGCPPGGTAVVTGPEASATPTNRAIMHRLEPSEALRMLIFDTVPVDRRVGVKLERPDG